MRSFAFLLLLGCVNCTAYVKIVDLTLDEDNPVPGDPILAFALDTGHIDGRPHEFDIFNYEFDMFNLTYNEMSQDWTPVNAGNYQAFLVKRVEGEEDNRWLDPTIPDFVEVPVSVEMDLRENDTAIFAVKHQPLSKSKYTMMGVNLGPLPVPDVAVVRLSIWGLYVGDVHPLVGGKIVYTSLMTLKVTGRETGCSDCKERNFGLSQGRDVTPTTPVSYWDFNISDSDVKKDITFSLSQDSGEIICEFSYKFSGEGVYTTIVQTDKESDYTVFTCGTYKLSSHPALFKTLNAILCLSVITLLLL